LYWSGELIAHLVRSTFPFPAANRVWSILAHEAADRGAGLCLIGYDTFMGGFSRVIPASTPSVEKLARLRYELNVEGLPAAAAVARVFRGGRPAELGEQVQETLVSSLARQPGTSPVQKLISYQGESGAGLRDKMSNRSGRVFVQSVAPLIDNEISDFFLSLPQRELHHARLYHRLLAPVNPVLAAIPTNVGKVVPLALMGDFYPVVRAARVAEVRVKTRLGRPLEGVVCEEERRVVTRLVEESEEFDPDGLDAVFASPYVTGHLKLLLCALKEFRGEEVKWA
jgi:hypothetical protein